MRPPGLPEPNVVEVRTHLGLAVQSYLTSDSSGLDLIVGLTEMAKVADAMLAEAVASARADGATWAELGQILGVTRQAAHRRFGREVAPSSEGVAVMASRRDELRDINELGRRGYRLSSVGLRRLEMQFVGVPTRHARAVGISAEAGRLVEEGWTIVGWRFPDVFFCREEVDESVELIDP